MGENGSLLEEMLTCGVSHLTTCKKTSRLFKDHCKDLVRPT